MSGYYYPPHQSPQGEQEFDLGEEFLASTGQPFQGYHPFTTVPTLPLTGHQPFYYDEPQQLYQQTTQFQHPAQYPAVQQASWVTPTVPSSYDPQHNIASFPLDPQTFNVGHELPLAGPSNTLTRYLSPDEAGRTRPSRATSLTSNASSAPSVSYSDISRSASPKASEMAKWVCDSYTFPLCVQLLAPTSCSC